MASPRRALPVDQYATVTLHKVELALLIQLVSRLHWSPDQTDLTEHTHDQLRQLLQHLGNAWEAIKLREERALAHRS